MEKEERHSEIMIAGGDRVIIKKGLIFNKASQPEIEGIVYSTTNMRNHKSIYKWCVVHAKGNFFTDNLRGELILQKKMQMNK